MSRGRNACMGPPIRASWGRASPSAVAAIKGLHVWQFALREYQACRFCGASYVGLWKYGVRHYICEDCRCAVLAVALC